MIKINKDELPQHIAIIMDGNGRWAKANQLSRSQGHVEGVKRVEEVVDEARRLGIKALTLYTFSTENWSRPENEVNMLMNLITAVLHRKIEKLIRENIKFTMIGRKQGIPESVLEAINEVESKTKDNTGIRLNLAFNYGSRLEIVDGIKMICRRVKKKELDVEDIKEETLNQVLYTRGLPDPDLLIRTSGEKRISNFLLWQLSYAEFYFTDKYWPDFRAEDFQTAIIDFQKRERRYGSVVAKK